MNVRYSLAVAVMALLPSTALWAQYGAPHRPHHRVTAAAGHWFNDGFVHRVHNGRIGFGATNGCDGKPICSLYDHSKPRPHCGCDPHREGLLEAIFGGGHCFKSKRHGRGCSSCDQPPCDCAPQITSSCGCDAVGCGGCKKKRCTPIKDALHRLFSCKKKCCGGCDMPCGCDGPMLYQRAMPLPQPSPSKPSPFKDDPVLDPAQPTKPETESALRPWPTRPIQAQGRYPTKSVWRQKTTTRLGTPPLTPTSSLPKYIKQTSFTKSPDEKEKHVEESTAPKAPRLNLENLDVYKVLDAEARRRDEPTQVKKPVRLLPINSLR